MIWNEEIWIRSLWKFLKELKIYHFKIKGNLFFSGSSFIVAKLEKSEALTLVLSIFIIYVLF